MGIIFGSVRAEPSAKMVYSRIPERTSSPLPDGVVPPWDVDADMPDEAASDEDILQEPAELPDEDEDVTLSSNFSADCSRSMSLLELSVCHTVQIATVVTSVIAHLATSPDSLMMF